MFGNQSQKIVPAINNQQITDRFILQNENSEQQIKPCQSKHDGQRISTSIDISMSQQSFELSGKVKQFELFLKQANEQIITPKILETPQRIQEEKILKQKSQQNNESNDYQEINKQQNYQIKTKISTNLINSRQQNKFIKSEHLKLKVYNSYQQKNEKLISKKNESEQLIQSEYDKQSNSQMKVSITQQLQINKLKLNQKMAQTNFKMCKNLIISAKQQKVRQLFQNKYYINNLHRSIQKQPQIIDISQESTQNSKYNLVNSKSNFNLNFKEKISTFLQQKLHQTKPIVVDKQVVFSRGNSQQLLAKIYLAKPIIARKINHQKVAEKLQSTTTLKTAFSCFKIREPKIQSYYIQ